MDLVQAMDEPGSGGIRQSTLDKAFIPPRISAGLDITL